MVKKMCLAVVGVIFVLGLSGCATTRKNNVSEIQGLRDQVTTLETQLRAKDDELNSMRESSASISSQPQIETSAEVKDHPTVKQIQQALKNSGYYQGTLDGRMGRNTRQAVRDFQKANNLKSDGKVGKNTWLALSVYLDKKVK